MPKSRIAAPRVSPSLTAAEYARLALTAHDRECRTCANPSNDYRCELGDRLAAATRPDLSWIPDTRHSTRRLTMPDPMTYERRTEILAALEPLPPYPWVWRDPWTLESGDDYPRPVLAADDSANPRGILFTTLDEGADDHRLASAQDLAEQGAPNPIAAWIANGAQYCEELFFENQRLAGELDSLQSSADRAMGDAYELRDEISRLKAENARLRNGEPAPAPALPVSADRIRELAERFVRQAAGAVEFQDILDGLGADQEISALPSSVGDDQFGDVCRAVHDLASKAVIAVALPEEA